MLSNEPKLKSAPPVQSNVEDFTVFADYCSIVFHEFLSYGTEGMLCCLHEIVRRKLLDLQKDNFCKLHHDNVPAHKSLSYSMIWGQKLHHAYVQLPCSPAETQ